MYGYPAADVGCKQGSILPAAKSLFVGCQLNLSRAICQLNLPYLYPLSPVCPTHHQHPSSAFRLENLCNTMHCNEGFDDRWHKANNIKPSWLHFPHRIWLPYLTLLFILECGFYPGCNIEMPATPFVHEDVHESGNRICI